MIVITISGFLKIISKIFFYIATKNLWILNLFNVQLKFQQCYSLLSVSITPLRSLIASPKTSDNTHSKKAISHSRPTCGIRFCNFSLHFLYPKKISFSLSKACLPSQQKHSQQWQITPSRGPDSVQQSCLEQTEVKWKKNPSTSAQQPQHKHGRAHTIIHLGERVVNKHIMLMLAN